MIDNLLHSFKEHTDTIIERNLTRPQETLDFKLNAEPDSFFYSPPFNRTKVSSATPWMVSVTHFETCYSVLLNLMRTKVFQILQQALVSTTRLNKTGKSRMGIKRA